MNALPDGKPLHIGYTDEEVTSPDGRWTSKWCYITEPPHGDGLFEVTIAGIKLPDLYWGRGHAWSPDSNYFTLERYTKNQKNYLWVVRVTELTWHQVKEYYGTDQFVYPVMTIHRYGNSQPREEYRFTGAEKWEPLGK